MRSMKTSLRVTVAALFLASTVAPSLAPAGEVPPGVSYVAPAPATTTTTSVSGTKGASQNAAALGSQGSNKSASGIANAIGSSLLATGSAMMPPCAAQMCACCPMAAMLIAMGLMGLAQSGANKGTAAQHGVNASLNQDYNTAADPTRDASTVSATGLGGKAISDLKKYGVNYDAKSGKFTLPDGKSFSLSDVGNANAMSAAGVSDAQYKQAMNMAKDAEKKASDALSKSKLAGFENGVSGGGGGLPALRSPAADEDIAGGKALPKPDGNVAGMARNFNGDKIGVAGDDIFAMMARRYREKDNKESFLSPEAAPDASL